VLPGHRRTLSRSAFVSEAIRLSALRIFVDVAVRVGSLRNQGLSTVGRNPHYAPARVGCPEYAIPLREDALGALKIVPDSAHGGGIYAEAGQRVGRGCVADECHGIAANWSAAQSAM
jgi:hypothetical protein